MKMSKVIVVSGSRGWTDKEIIRQRILEAQPTLVVQGGCNKGADKLCREVCEEEGIPCETESAKWKRYGKAAGGIRNAAMLSAWSPSEVLVFWDGKSKGTANMINVAALNGYPLQVNL